MAGINLAGAVGMTGKRESIFSDLAPIVQHTGDAIAKSIQESKAKREKEALLKLQKEQEGKIKNADEWDKFILSKSDLSPELSSPYFKESTEIGKEVMAINANPNIPQAKKQEIIESKKLDVIRSYNKHKDDEEAIKYFQTALNDDTLDVSKASNFLAGTENVTTKDKEVLTNEQTAPYKVNVPMEDAQTQTISETTGVEPQYFSLSAAERMKKTPMGLGTTLREKIGLVNTTPEETIKSILPEQTWDDIVEGTTTNGNTKFEVNKDKQKGAEDLYVYNVTEGASTKGKILKRGYEALAFKKLKEDHQNLTDAEIAELIPKMVEDRAREDYRNIADKKIGAIINDKTTKFSTKQPSGGLNINFGQGGTLNKYNIGKPLVVDYWHKGDKSPSEQKEFYAIQTITPSDNPPTIALGSNKGVLEGVYKNSKGQVDAVRMKIPIESTEAGAAITYETKIIPIKDKQELEVVKSNIGDGFNEAIGIGKSDIVSKSKEKNVSSQSKKEGEKDSGYESWKKTLPSDLQNESDYDLEGFYNKNKGTEKLKPNAKLHLVDEFKLPTHITFSTGSKYSTPEHKGGEWKGSDKSGWVFKASPFNLQHHSVAEIKQYMKDYEKESKLELPKEVKFDIDGKVGTIPIDNVDAFKKKYPNAKVK